MALDIDSVQSFTDAELLKLYRAALAAISTGQSYIIGSQELTRANIGGVRETIGWLETRIESDGENTNVALARFGEVV